VRIIVFICVAVVVDGKASVKVDLSVKKLITSRQQTADSRQQTADRPKQTSSDTT
jgi:hypothetical protein